MCTYSSCKIISTENFGCKMMRCCSKEKLNGSCPKTSTGITHVCPSKLSKRELEDLYFTLAQKNLELKQTINQLSEKIKYQTTKLQRMLSTQQAYMGSEPRDCCATAKAIVQEQKQVIIELKNANVGLQEQINNLNMKLCTTKQFMPRTRSATARNTPRSKSQRSKSPSKSPTKTPSKTPSKSPRGKQKASPRTPVSVENASTSVYHEKCTDEGVQSTEMKSVSCQCLDPEHCQKMRNQLCDQNKCKTQMEEMQQKILNLQEELSKTHDEYANRIARLESEVINLQSENLHVVGERAMFEQNMRARSNEAGEIKKKLAETECRCEKLCADLSIEKGKVAELQTQVKAANMTGGAVKAIEERLNKETTSTSRRDSISGAGAPIVFSPNASLPNESKSTEDKSSPGVISPDKDGSYNVNVNPKDVYRNIPEQEGVSNANKFPGNIIGTITKYAQADETNFKFNADLCVCPESSENVTSDKIREDETQPKPFSLFETARKFKDNAVQKFYDKTSHSPGDTVKISDDQYTPDQLKTRQTNLTPHDTVKYPESTDQNVEKNIDTRQFRDNANRKSQNHNIGSPGDTVKLFDDQYTQDQLQTRQRNLTPHDTLKYSESTDQNIVNYRDTSQFSNNDNQKPEENSRTRRDTIKYFDDRYIQDQLQNRQINLTSGDEVKYPESNDQSAVKHRDTRQFRDNTNQKSQDNSRTPGDTIKHFDDQYTQDQLQNRQTNLTPLDAEKYPESTDQSVVKYRDTNTSRLRYLNRPTGDSSCKHSYALDTGETPSKGQGPVDSYNSDIRRDSNQLDGNTSIKSKKENDLRKNTVQRSVVDKNKESGAGKCLKPGDDKVDYTTEYRSQYNKYYPKDPLDLRISSPETTEKRMSPGPSSGLPKSSKQSPDPGRRPTELDRRSSEAGRRSPELDRRSSEAGRRSPELDRRLSEAGRPSPEVDRRSSEAGVRSPEPGRQSHAAGRRSKFEVLLDQSKKSGSPSQESQRTQMSYHSAQTSLAQQRETSDKSADTSTAKTADDSGFTELNIYHAASPEGKALRRENEELEKRVSEMQAQLEELKNHVLLRKDTFTVFKDEASSYDEKQKPDSGTQATIIPFDASAQTDNPRDSKVDHRRVSLREPTRGNVVLEQQSKDQTEEASNTEKTKLKRLKYDYPQYNKVPTCETTCKREGLPCTEECQNENKKKGQNQPTNRNYNRMNDDDIRYQIPEPASAYTPDVSDTRHVNDQNNLQLKDKQGEADKIENTTAKHPEYNHPKYSKIPTCESTCKREGLPCTKECQNENEKKVQGQPNSGIKRRNDDDNRYQIPGPVSAYTPDVSGTRRVNDQNNIQPMELSTNRAWRTGYGSSTQQDFFGAGSSKEPRHTGNVKEESPLMNFTQNFDNRGSSNVQNYQEPSRNAQYAKENAFSSQHGKNNDTWLKPAGTNTNNKNPWHIETSNGIQHQQEGENCNCAGCQRLKEIIAKARNVDLKPVSGKNTSTKSASKATKKIPVKCMCPHKSEYTTNILHTSTGPIIMPNLHHITGNDDSPYASSIEKRNLFLFQDTMQTLVSNTAEGQKQISMLDGNKATIDKSFNQTREADENQNDVCKNNQTNLQTNKQDRQDNAKYSKIQRTETVPVTENRESRFLENEMYFNPNEDLHQKRTCFVDNYGNVRNLNYDVSRDAIVQKNSRHKTGLTDINSHERQFADNKLNNFDEKGPDSLLHEIKGGLNAQKKTDDFENNMQQLQPLPVATSSPFAHVSDRTTQKTDKATDNKLDVSESCTQTCTGPKTTYRDVEVFRSCSGTLRFETINNPCQSRKSISSSPGFLNVHGTRQDTSCCKFKTEQNTYTIEASADKTPKPAEQKYSRATSPENTDQEISSLTDLPSEKTSTTPRETIGCGTCARISPGEDKSTTVKSETVTSPTTSSKPASYPLSDGEMPQYFAGSPKARNESFYMDPEPLEEKRKEVGKSTLKVEQALQSISEELARCRELLEKPKETLPQKERERTIRLKDLVENEKLNDNERGYVEGRKNYHEAFGPNPGRSSFALHHAQAKPHIGNVPNTPHVIFTLHIGTVVLSDEAVINSRNLNLVLTWKFYDQNEAMSHMRPSRVVHFDFSTEYDVNLTDHFLNYMRTEELEINICELTKLNSPFASCSMPLREALLHTNRRADMSLALVAGPQMRRSSAKDKLDTRDEMGVLDLWCMLRSEPRNFPRISLAIAQSRPSRIDSYGMRQQKYADTALNPLTINENQDGKRGSSDLDQVFQQPIRLQDRDSKQPSRRSTARLAINEVRSKSTGQLVLTPELMEKFPGAHNIRKVSLVSNQGINSSLIMAPPDQSEKRNWKNPQEIEQSLKRASNIDLIRNNQRISTDSGKYTMTDFPVKGTGRFDGTKKAVDAYNSVRNKRERDRLSDRFHDAMIGNKNKDSLTIDITILWLALNEECPAMSERSVQKLYVAYSFLGRGGAELETPQSLPKPKQYQDKCYFNFKKSFHLTNADLVAVGRLARYRTPHNGTPNPKESVVFTVVSEPAEDPLGLNNCEDIGYAYLYFGDLVAFSADNDSYTEVIPVHDAQTRNCICGVLSVRVDGLNVVRKCLTISLTDPKFRKNS